MENLEFQRIKELIILTNKKIDEGLSNGTLEYEKRFIVKSTANNFNDNEQGSFSCGRSFQLISKNVWFKNDGKKIIKKSIQDSQAYKKALDCLNSIYRSNINAKYLNSLIYHTIALLEDKSILNHKEIEVLAENFIREINDEPITYGAHVELCGITLLRVKIDLTEGVYLRRPKAEDVEREFDIYPSVCDDTRNPSAILNIEFLLKDTNELHEYVYKEVALLRLFKVGSVDFIRYDEYSGSILKSGSSITKLTNNVLDSYSLLEKDEVKLREFWNKFSPILPDSFFGFNQTQIDYLTIAFNRYDDSLFMFGSSKSVPEKRLSSSIMGLEALFLKTSERNELNYKLSKRISKFMGLLGYDAIKIGKTVKEAYNLRSKFVHGDHLDSEDILKFERRIKGENFKILNEKEGMQHFIRFVIELLRVSVLLIML